MRPKHKTPLNLQPNRLRSEAEAALTPASLAREVGRNKVTGQRKEHVESLFRLVLGSWIFISHAPLFGFLSFDLSDGFVRDGLPRIINFSLGNQFLFALGRATQDRRLSGGLGSVEMAGCTWIRPRVLGQKTIRVADDAKNENTKHPQGCRRLQTRRARGCHARTPFQVVG